MEMSVKYTIIPMIELYQKYVSPYKGYCCAHHALHNGLSCSEWGKRAAEKAGFLRFFPLIIRRFKACNAAYQQLLSMASEAGEGTEKSDEDKTKKEYNPFTDKENIACCVSGSPCLPFVK